MELQKSNLVTGYSMVRELDKVDYNEIRKIVDILTIEELEELYESHNSLNPRNSKRETRKEWIARYKGRQKLIEKWSNWFENNMEIIQEETGLTKKETREGFAKALRKRQEEELEVNSSLINPVKISLLTSVKVYLNNPDKLTEGKPYQPRSKSDNKSDKLSSFLTENHPSQLLDDQNFDLRIQTIDKTELLGEIMNKSVFTLQTIQINLFQNSSKLQIAEAYGENFEVGFGSVQIPFIRASMTDSPHRVRFKLKIGGFVDLTDGDLSFDISVENPLEKIKETKRITV